MTARSIFTAATLILAIVLYPLTVQSDEAAVEDRPARDIATALTHSEIVTAEASSHETPEVAGEPFRDCPECPVLVIVEPGSFMMGRQEDPHCWEVGDPVVQVTIAYPLAVSVYEVRVDEWEACRREAGCFHDPEDGGHELEGRPVTAVSWEDAQQYVRWLSAKTGEEYRLPSEAEWLYLSSVSKDGTNWYWPSVSGQIDLFGSVSDRYDLHGLSSGVMEWTDEPGYHCFTGMPDATGRQNDKLRILRGPSECWFPRALYLGIRWPAFREARGDCFGFRVVRPVGSGEWAP